MPTYESAALYIDFSRLPPPKVIEEIDYEKLLDTYQAQVVGKLPVLSRAIELEQSPTNVVLEAQSYGDMILRQRINAAARSSMLAFATGADLDNLAAFYSQNQMFPVVRLALVASPGDYATNPRDWESDDRFRRRIQLAPEAYASAGSEGGYIFHALTADVTLRDASAIRVNDRGLVQVTLMNSGDDPMPTTAQLDAVRTRLNLRKIKPLTDAVRVSPVSVLRTEIAGSITLYPGPDSALVVADVKAALGRLRARLSLLGRDLTRSAIIAACSQEGVENVQLSSPSADIPTDPTQCVLITKADIAVNTLRVE